MRTFMTRANMRMIGSLLAAIDRQGEIAAPTEGAASVRIRAIHSCGKIFRALRIFRGRMSRLQPRRTSMRKSLRSLVLAALASGALSMIMPAAAADAPPAHYSVSTTLVGKMLDDPAANAVLQKMIPTVYANEMFKTSGRELTLKAIQQYEPEALSDANLAKVQAELDKIPAKN
jgi:hypothetical protein